MLLINSSRSFMLLVSFIKLATFPVLIIRCLLVLCLEIQVGAKDCRGSRIVGWLNFASCSSLCFCAV